MYHSNKEDEKKSLKGFRKSHKQIKSIYDDLEKPQGRRRRRCKKIFSRVQ